MRKALFVLTAILVFALACAAPADTSEEPAANSETNQTTNSKEQTNDTQTEIDARNRRQFCTNMPTILNIVENHLFNMVEYANAGLDNQVNVILMGNEAGITAGVSNGDWRTRNLPAPTDNKKLGRSIDKFNEKLTEYHANFEEASERTITRGLQDLIDDFLDIQSDVEDYCGS